LTLATPKGPEWPGSTGLATPIGEGRFRDSR
jgi:hypothetical protein